MPSAVPLTPDEIDDLIYFSRTNDLSSLTHTITTLCTTHACSSQDILTAAVDLDGDGAGTASSLLHYPAANGNLEIVRYLLDIIADPSSESTTTSTTTTATASDVPKPRGPDALVNHRNVSGNTALHWAGMNGHLEVVKALVGAGADPGLVNCAGRDAVVESEWSAKEGAEGCAVWMLSVCGGLERGVGEGEGEDAGVEEGEGVNGVVDGDGNGDGKHEGGEGSKESAA